MIKIHVTDGGRVEQVDMKWSGMHPDPVYKCRICGQRLTSTQVEDVQDNDRRIT